MEIKVYISLPHNEKNCQRWGGIMRKLRGMVDGKRVFLTSLGDVRERRPYLKDEELAEFITNAHHLTEVNFVVFGKGWETDKRSQIEHAVAVLYNIPHCGVEEIETFFRNYIASTFKFDIGNIESGS